ncbi:hypothetical protein MNBD_GAMMA26-318 [hydrothermal vent metagenome]|uniref:General secretion pathway protein L n=1 Tax=hydrothermal vent metagenome TaxID=652676 RepID=A0A3B1BGF5_9ZZZZ
MAEHILIRFSADQFEWLVVNKKGSSQSGVGRGNGGELVNICRRKQVVLLVPGADVLLTQVTLPTRNASGIARALPYAVEDQLAEDVETLHFARGVQDSDGAMPVAVIRRQCLDQYLDVLAQLEIKPTNVYAAPLLLPWEEDTWSILIEDNKALLRYGHDQGMELGLDCLLPIVERLLREQEDRRPRLRVWYGGDSEPDTSKLALTGCKVDVTPVPETGMALMASSLARGDKLDLLQGDYGQQGADLLSFRPWRVALVMLLLALLVQMGGMGYQHWQLMEEDRVLAKDIETLYRAAFPEVKKIIRGTESREASRRLEELRRRYGRGSDPFLALLYTSGNELRSEQDLKLVGLSFKSGVLTLRLKGTDLSQFETFKQKLLQGRESEIEVVVLSAITRKDGVDGRIMVQERGS